MSTQPFSWDELKANGFICGEAVELPQFAFVLSGASFGDLNGRQGVVDLVGVEDGEVPPVTAALFVLHAIDDSTISPGLTQTKASARSTFGGNWHHHGFDLGIRDTTAGRQL